MLFLSASVIVTVIMFNMLIAIMGDTFNRVNAHRNLYALKTKISFVSELSSNLNIGSNSKHDMQ